MTQPALVLHVGAPKCGSSALQTALSMSPDLEDTEGQRYRYTGLVNYRKRQVPIYGSWARKLAQLSPYGYVSWPDFHRDRDPAQVFAPMERVMRRGARKGFVPILSSEGWISHPALFARQLQYWGYPPVKVVAYLRPPVAWMNASYWQWGVWTAPTLDAWLARTVLPYRYGLDLEAWSRIPNVTLEVGGTRPDVVGKFATALNVTLPSENRRNTTSSAALIGFFLRNRRFRQDAHAAAVEFVIQRWCPPVGGRGPWGVLARHVHQLREVTSINLEALRRILSDGALNDVLQDEGFLRERCYHEQIIAGPSGLGRVSDLPALLGSFEAGLVKARAAAGQAPAAPLEPPQAGAALPDWDAALADRLDLLLAADLQVRRQAFLLAVPLMRLLRGRWNLTS